MPPLRTHEEVNDIPFVLDDKARARGLFIGVESQRAPLKCYKGSFIWSTVYVYGIQQTMKRSVFRLIVVLLAAAVLTAVVITTFLNSSKADHSADFARSIEGTGWSPIKPISQIADNAYSGSYRASSGNGSFTLTVTIEIAQSEAAARERYGQLVLQKQNDGYASGESNLGNSTIWGDPTASWFGYTTNSPVNASTSASTSASTGASTYTFLYAFDKEINSWVVVTETTDTIGQNLS
jgi:hypothetical protein